MRQILWLFAFLCMSIILLQSCCDIYMQTPLVFTITAIPKQDSIQVWGIKNGKTLEKTSAQYVSSQANFIGETHSFAFQKTLDMSTNQSVLVLGYKNNTQTFVTDTLTISYQRSASYTDRCGGVTYWSNPTITKSTFNPPITVTIGR
jgi:hypothetical protein